MLARAPITFGVVALVAVVALLAGDQRRARASSDGAHRTLTAEGIIEASIAARGGRARFARLKKMHVTGRIDDLTNGGNAHWDSTSSMPGNLDYKMEPYPFGGFYELRVRGDSVTEHDTDWHDVTGHAHDESVIDATFDGELRWRELFPTVKLLGQMKFEDQPAWAIEMVSRAGRTRTVYYAVETFLPIGEDSIISMDDLHRPGTDDVERTFTMHTSMSDFRDVDGLVYAFRTVRHSAADYLHEFVITTESMTLSFK